MKKDYKIHGDKIHKYIAIVEAESPELAWEPIEPYNVEEV